MTWIDLCPETSTRCLRGVTESQSECENEEFLLNFVALISRNRDFLEQLEQIKGGKVTFRDGEQGKILGVGVMKITDLPCLINVYFLDGLKANLSNVSQLCDYGLNDIFTSQECEAVDMSGNLMLCEVPSGNNCNI
ncbi:hypothetical protein Bca4012_030461 [Brassica carinata]